MQRTIMNDNAQRNATYHITAGQNCIEPHSIAAMPDQPRCLRPELPPPVREQMICCWIPAGTPKSSRVGGSPQQPVQGGDHGRCAKATADGSTSRPLPRRARRGARGLAGDLEPRRLRKGRAGKTTPRTKDSESSRNPQGEARGPPEATEDLRKLPGAAEASRGRQGTHRKPREAIRTIPGPRRPSRAPSEPPRVRSRPSPPRGSRGQG